MLKKVPYPDPSNPGQSIDHHNVSFTLPSYVYIPNRDDIKVGWWDVENNKWQHGGDHIINAELDATNVLQFQMARFAPVALLQSRCTDYPYKSWNLRSIGAEKALLDIETKRMKIKFEIGTDYVKLIDRKENELKHLVDKELQPGYLLHMLSKSGIHLLPNNEDAKLAGINLKTDGVEQSSILDIICGIRGFAFRSCKWNVNASRENIVMKIRENLEYDPDFFEDYEEDWTYVKWWEDKVAYVKTRDPSDAPNFDQEDGEETHALLNVITKDRFSEEANDRLTQYYIDFQLTLKKFITLL